LSRPTIAVTMPLFWMNSTWRWNVAGVSLSKPTMNPPCTSSPARWMRLTSAIMSRPRFWRLSHSVRLASSVVSMPMNTVSNPASTIMRISRASSARLIEASVKNEMPCLPLRQAISAGSSDSLRKRLLPMKLSSTKNTGLRQPSR